MGILSNTVSMYQYQVRGEPPDDAWVAERLEKYRFAPVDDIAEVETTGWVTLDDTNAADFGNVNVFSRPPYHVFTMRRDQRRVPQAALRVLVDRECAKWLAERPALTRVPARRRMEIREAVHASLTARTLPVPSTWDLVWNTDTSILTVCAVTEKVLDVVEDFFKKTFEGRTLEPVHPMARSRMVLGGDLRGLLDKHDEAPSKDVLLQIKRNRWLGWEFLLWLTYSTAQGRTAFEVQRDGPLSRGEGFIAYVHDRFVLAAEHESGRRTTSIKGLQTEFAEVRQAVSDGKNITEATVYMERGEMTWRLNLKADIFAFASFACPVVRLERDDAADPLSERMALFYERMGLVETGLQLFDSLLAAFLEERLGGGWDGLRSRIDRWLAGR